MSRSLAHPRRAVVLGATGHIGSAVVRELLARGVEVTATTRRAAPTPNLVGLDVTLASGDSDDPAQLDAWVAGHDLVVDAAAPYPMWMFRPTVPAEADPQRYAQARTERVINAVRRHDATLALVGSFTTLPHPGTLRGELEPKILYRSHPYFAVKETVESMVLAATKSGLRALVVNPTAFLGPWDFKEPAMCFLPTVLSGRVPATVGRVVNVIDVRDVATALVDAVATGRLGGRIPLSGHDIRIDELSRLACSMHGVAPPSFRGSSRAFAALSYWAEAAYGVFGKQSPAPALPMLLVRYSYPSDPSPEQRELGTVIRPLSSTLRDAIDWYSSIGYL